MSEYDEIAKKFGGKWEAVERKNVDDFMKEVGIGLPMRKAAGLINPCLIISVENNEVKIVRKMSVKTVTNTFTIGVAKQISDYDKTFESTLTYADGVMTFENKPVDAKSKKIVAKRQIDGAFLIQTMYCNDVVATTKFKKSG